jgi:hypothetical protein
MLQLHSSISFPLPISSRLSPSPPFTVYLPAPINKSRDVPDSVSSRCSEPVKASQIGHLCLRAEGERGLESIIAEILVAGLSGRIAWPRPASVDRLLASPSDGLKHVTLTEQWPLNNQLYTIAMSLYLDSPDSGTHAIPQPTVPQLGLWDPACLLGSAVRRVVMQAHGDDVCTVVYSSVTVQLA